MRNVFGIALALWMAAAFLPGAAQAQQAYNYGTNETNLWSVNGRGGVAFPTGHFADFQDIGANVGLDIGYQVTPYLQLRADGALQMLGGATRLVGAGRYPDLDIWSYMGTASLRVTNETTFPWSASINAGAGASTFHFASSAKEDEALGDLRNNRTYFTLRGGAEVRYVVSRQIELFTRGDVCWMNTRKKDFASLTRADGSELIGNSTVSIPVSAGLWFRL